MRHGAVAGLQTGSYFFSLQVPGLPQQLSARPFWSAAAQPPLSLLLCQRARFKLNFKPYFTGTFACSCSPHNHFLRSNLFQFLFTQLRRRYLYQQSCYISWQTEFALAGFYFPSGRRRHCDLDVGCSIVFVKNLQWYQ